MTILYKSSIVNHINMHVHKKDEWNLDNLNLYEMQTITSSVHTAQFQVINEIPSNVIDPTNRPVW